MPVLVVISAHEVLDPSACGVEAGKPSSGHCGQYFNVLNNDSQYGLSLLTRGRSLLTNHDWWYERITKMMVFTLDPLSLSAEKSSTDPRD